MLDEDQYYISVWKVSSKETNITIITIYHPPYSNQLPVTNAMFLDGITE